MNQYYFDKLKEYLELMNYDEIEVPAAMTIHLDLENIKQIGNDDIKHTEKWRTRHLNLRANYDIEELAGATHREIEIDRFFLRAHEKVKARAMESC